MNKDDESKKSGARAGVAFAWIVVLCVSAVIVAATIKGIQLILH